MGKGVSLGKEAVLAASGRAGEVAAGVRAGEKSDFFSILLAAPIELRNHLNHVDLLRFCQFGIDRDRHHLFGRSF